MKIHLVIVFAFMMVLCLAGGQQPPPLQLNTPYQCGNNIIVVVKHCEMRNGAETCSLVKGPANGPLGDEISLPKAQAAAIGLICLPQGGPPQSTKGVTSANGRSFNPPYLAEMPPVDRVIAAMKTNDPHETALRQVWAFYELGEIIKTLSGDREFRGLLPDEQKVLGEYEVAQYKVGQETGKAFPNNPPSGDLTYHFARWDPRFGYKGINIWQFFSDGVQQQFAQIVGKDNARYAAMRAEQKRIAAQGMSANPSNVPAAQQGMRNDAGSVAARRCIESGRSELECMGEGLKVGVNDLMGGDLVASVTGQTPAKGLRLSGAYSNTTGKSLHLAFSQENAFTGCGGLDPVGLPYEVSRTGNQILVKVSISPQPLVVAFRPDGTLAGPSDVAVTGLVPVGSGGGGSSAQGYQAQTHTETRERQIDAAEAHNYQGTDAVHQNGMEYSVSEQVTSTTYETVPVKIYQLPPMTSKTERCTVGVMQGKSSYGTVPEALTQLVNPSAKKGPVVPPGLRLAGAYAGQSGLRIEFREDLATVECGEAHVAESYVVQNVSGQISVKVQNGATSFTLNLQPNGSLIGSGAIDVAGRIVTGSTDNALTYAARNARCAIGTLTVN
jgi:hypothetical protein